MRFLNPAIIETLAKGGGNPNAKRKYSGETPLHVAALNAANPMIIEALLEAGADPTVRTRNGKLPWDLAQENSQIIGSAPYRRLKDAQF